MPIATTPFDDEGRLDLSGLAAVVEHVLRSGAHGVVYPAIASEFQTLAPEERLSAVEQVLDVVDGRKPTVVGISCADDRISSAELAAHAADRGAAALMLMPPPTREGSGRPPHAVFEEVAGRCPLPIVLQNAPPPLGPALSVEAVLEIVQAVPGVRYVKEETLPCGHRISRLLQGERALAGVFGGAGGRFVLDELARGSVGSMPACEFTAIHVMLYDRFRAGDHAAARRIFNMMLPLLNFESVFRTSVTKHILHRMGIISSPRYRDHNPDLDDSDRKELAVILEDMGAWASPAVQS